VKNSAGGSIVPRRIVHGRASNCSQKRLTTIET